MRIRSKRAGRVNFAIAIDNNAAKKTMPMNHLKRDFTLPSSPWALNWATNLVNTRTRIEIGNANAPAN